MKVLEKESLLSYKGELPEGDEFEVTAQVKNRKGMWVFLTTEDPLTCGWHDIRNVKGWLS